MERYTTLWKTAQNLYATNSPVVISAGALVKDNETDKILVQLKFRNISDALIKAIKIEIIPYSVDNNELSAKTEFQYLDLTAAYNTEFGQKTPVFLPDNTTRAFKVICKSVVFVNGAKWENTDNTVFEPTDYPQGIRNKINTTNNFIQFIDFATKEDIKDNTNIFWQHHDKEKIITQKNELSDSLTYTTGELYTETNELISKYTAILTAQRKADEDFSEDELNTIKCYNEIKSKLKEEKSRVLENKSKKKEKTVKTVTIVTSATVAFLTAFCIIYSTIILPAINYNKAITFMENGQFQNAIAIFEALDGYKDSEEMIDIAYNEPIYLRATNYLKAGNYENAIDLFDSISAYKDSAELLKESKYKYAMYCFEQKDYHTADKYFKGIYFKDSVEMQYYCRAILAERDSIETAYSKYEYILTTYPDFKYINIIKQRMELLEKYLPYTGFYKFSHGSGRFLSVYDESKKITICILNDKIYCNDKEFEKSDNDNYDYKFGDFYISESTLFFSLYIDNSYTEAYYTKNF